jgi:hypothetical protein
MKFTTKVFFSSFIAAILFASNVAVAAPATPTADVQASSYMQNCWSGCDGECKYPDHSIAVDT